MYEHLLAAEKRCDLHLPADSMDGGEVLRRVSEAKKRLPSAAMGVVLAACFVIDPISTSIAFTTSLAMSAAMAK